MKYWVSGIPTDNCINHPNASQTNSDTDAFGDTCENCPNMCNAQQLDADSDGSGDVCDADPGCEMSCCGTCSLPTCEYECTP